MIRRIGTVVATLAVVALVSGCVCGGKAADHPRSAEHPAKAEHPARTEHAQGQEHPKSSEHPEHPK